jgi:hypothetical protein
VQRVIPPRRARLPTASASPPTSAPAYEENTQRSAVLPGDARVRVGNRSRPAGRIPTPPASSGRRFATFYDTWRVLPWRRSASSGR